MVEMNETVEHNLKRIISALENEVIPSTPTRTLMTPPAKNSEHLRAVAESRRAETMVEQRGHLRSWRAWARAFQSPRSASALACRERGCTASRN